MFTFDLSTYYHRINLGMSPFGFAMQQVCIVILNNYHNVCKVCCRDSAYDIYGNCCTLIIDESN